MLLVCSWLQSCLNILFEMCSEKIDLDYYTMLWFSCFVLFLRTLSGALQYMWYVLYRIASFMTLLNIRKNLFAYTFEPSLSMPESLLFSASPHSLPLSSLFYFLPSPLIPHLRLMEEGGVNLHWLPWHQTALAWWRHVVSSVLFPQSFPRGRVCICVWQHWVRKKTETTSVCITCQLCQITDRSNAKSLQVACNEVMRHLLKI